MESQNAGSLVKMRALLVQQGLLKLLSGKSKLSEFMSEDEKEELEMKAHSTIQLCLDDEVLREVADEDIAAGLWLKLESLYMIKSLTNKLYLKQRLFTLRMKEGTCNTLLPGVRITVSALFLLSYLSLFSYLL